MSVYTFVSLNVRFFSISTFRDHISIVGYEFVCFLKIMRVENMHVQFMLFSLWFCVQRERKLTESLKQYTESLLNFLQKVYGKVFYGFYAGLFQ